MDSGRCGRGEVSFVENEAGAQSGSLYEALFGQREAWRDRANCRGLDPDLFYPERGGSTVEAKKVCSGCVVREDCLEFALANREKIGIWGGTSERERRNLRRGRRRSAAA